MYAKKHHTAVKSVKRISATQFSNFLAKYHPNFFRLYCKNHPTVVHSISNKHYAIVQFLGQELPDSGSVANLRFSLSGKYHNRVVHSVSPHRSSICAAKLAT